MFVQQAIQSILDRQRFENLWRACNKVLVLALNRVATTHLKPGSFSHEVQAAVTSPEHQLGGLPSKAGTHLRKNALERWPPRAPSCTLPWLSPVKRKSNGSFTSEAHS